MDDVTLASKSAEFVMEFAKLGQRLALIPVWVDTLILYYGGFGSWVLVARKGDKAFRFSFDGRDRFIQVEVSPVRELSGPNQWKKEAAAAARDWREAILYAETYLRGRFGA